MKKLNIKETDLVLSVPYSLLHWFSCLENITENDRRWDLFSVEQGSDTKPCILMSSEVHMFDEWGHSSES